MSMKNERRDEYIDDIGSIYSKMESIEKNLSYEEDREEAEKEVEAYYKVIERLLEDRRELDAIDVSKFSFERPPAYFYTVDIPDNDGTNYIEEGEEIGEEGLKLLKERLPKAFPNKKDDKGCNPYLMVLQEVEERLMPYSIGWNVYSLFEELSSPKEASLALYAMGYKGIHYYGGRDGECCVIYDENDLKITFRIQRMKGKPARCMGGARRSMTRMGISLRRRLLRQTTYRLRQATVREGNCLNECEGILSANGLAVASTPQETAPTSSPQT